MRLASILGERGPGVAIVRGDRVLELDEFMDMRGIAMTLDGVPWVRHWAEAQPEEAWHPLAEVSLLPAVPDPGAIYTVGLNYDGPGAAPRPAAPLIYGKAASSVAAHGATLAWDREVTDDVDAEVELGVVIGAGGSIFGYTCINDVSARDERLDGDQWLLGKSMPGFCPVGPWIVTADAFDPADVRLTCAIDGQLTQVGRTSQMRFGIAEIVTFLSRHLELRPGDLIATGTPARLATPPGPTRRLRPGDTVTVSIEGIGDLTTHIA